MPMDFPDLKSLEEAASVWKFRSREKAEGEEQYREALADFVQPKDFIESMEIRKGKSWDKFTDEDNEEILLRNRTERMR
jgi:hypothetical protein